MTEKTRTTKDFPQAINLSFGLSVGLIDAQERQRIQLQQWHCPLMTDSLLSIRLGECWGKPSADLASEERKTEHDRQQSTAELPATANGQHR